MNPWFLLAVAIACEICGSTSLKLSEGMTRLPWAGVVIGAYGVAFYCFSVAIKALPLGLAYAVWSGVGTIGTFLVGWQLFGEPAAWPKWVGVGLVIGGICMLNLPARSP